MLTFIVMLFLHAKFAKTGPRFADIHYTEFWAAFVLYLDLIHRGAKTLKFAYEYVSVLVSSRLCRIRQHTA